MNTINVEELSAMIDYAMRVVNALPEESLRRTYSAEMTQVIEEYNHEVAALKEALETYFQKEEEKNLPPNLSLHRAYKNLRYL